MPAAKMISLTLVASVLHRISAGNARASMVEVQGSDVAPGLRPKSDTKFFGKDYPEDLRPEVVHRFDHPYPSVQDDSDYDQDFVQDENHDNGEWTAQMEYDALKTRLQREKTEMMRAKEKMEDEKREYESIAGKEAAAERETEALEERAEKAADAAEDKAYKKHHASGQAQDVEDESEDLKKCEDELRTAKEELKRLLEQVKAADHASSEAADNADAAEAESVAAEKDEAVWEDKVSRLDKLHKSIWEKYEAKLAELKVLEAKLSKAAQKLAGLRAPQIDSKGAIVQDGKSGDPVAFHSGTARLLERRVAIFAFVTLFLFALP